MDESPSITNKTILVTSSKGIERAYSNGSGAWHVDTVLADQDANCLAADPLNGDIIYTGTQGNGVFRSQDRGQTWEQSGMTGQIVKALAVSPHQPGLLFAGTKPAYMFVSHDGGQNWQELDGFRDIPFRWWWFSPAEKPFKAYVQAITISPTEPDVVLAGIEFGAVVRSEDGGQTWSSHRKGAGRDCHNLKFHATNGQWVYEAEGGGACVSRNAGRSWTKAKKGLAKRYGVACAADPQRPEIWYVTVAPSPGKAYGQEAEAYFYRASGGAGWEAIGWEPHPMQHMPIALTTDADSPGNLYAGTIPGEVWHSADYGDTWQQLPFSFTAVWRTMIVL